ncbi:BQ5605_C009g05559 [Microbotryum silenes-dioicae]|uniref:BQ5605_C009g05559 protein n=1 Tax=Microbotryum silenes-dioicae TaxID=796604 RepID=A0A2X0PFL1_9BASI|nr:BQ5605_C009g05559 [Microbotryum silenes-dioicae]
MAIDPFSDDNYAPPDWDPSNPIPTSGPQTEAALLQILSAWDGSDNSVLSVASLANLKDGFQAAARDSDPSTLLLWEPQLAKLPLGKSLSVEALLEADVHPVIAHALGCGRPSEYLSRYGAHFWTKNMASYRLRRQSSAGPPPPLKRVTAIEHVGDLPTYTFDELEKDGAGQIVVHTALFVEGDVDPATFPPEVDYKFSRLPRGWVLRPPSAATPSGRPLHRSEQASRTSKRPVAMDFDWEDITDEGENDDAVAAAQGEALMAQVRQLDPRAKKSKAIPAPRPTALAPHPPSAFRPSSQQLNPENDLPPATLSTYQPLDPDDPGPPRDPLKDFLDGVLNAPTSRQKPLPDYVLGLRQKQEFSKEQASIKASTRIHSKKSKANLDVLGGPIGHLRALKNLEALENAAFFTHQGRNWVHYLDFLEEVAAWPAWGYEFMALYDDQFRRTLADHSSSIHSLLQASWGDVVMHECQAEWTKKSSRALIQASFDQPGPHTGPVLHHHDGAKRSRRGRPTCSLWNQGFDHNIQLCKFRHICNICREQTHGRKIQFDLHLPVQCTTKFHPPSRSKPPYPLLCKVVLHPLLRARANFSRLALSRLAVSS